jgi:hypothetical protein
MASDIQPSRLSDEALAASGQFDRAIKKHCAFAPESCNGEYAKLF